MQNKNSPRGIPRLAFPKRLVIGFLRLFFKLLYHQLAFTYDLVAAIVSLGAWQKWVNSIVPYLDGRKILEIGYGPGHLQVALHHKGVPVIGLDESHQMGKIARRRLIKMGFHPNLVRGDALNLPFSNNSFDQVVMTFPSEYILKAQTFAELHRILSDKGEVIMLPLAWITGQNPLERFIAWINRITGEAPAWDENALLPLKKYRFDVSWEMIDFHSSKILVIRMCKIDS